MRMRRAEKIGTCLACGRPLSKGWWTYCYRCWREKRAALNSWHHQLEKYVREHMTPAEMNEVYALYLDLAPLTGGGVAEPGPLPPDDATQLRGRES
jgi:hypothetical protein